MKPSLTVRTAVTASVLALAAALSPQNAVAQAYPTTDIRFVCVFPAGSGADVYVRFFAEQVQKVSGKNIIVENKPGAGGNSGTALAAKAAPDGYTLVGAGSGPIAANVSLYKNLGYDPVKELAVISPFASFTIVVAASNKLGIKNLKELIERAKKEPGALNYGSVGIGSSQHLAGEYFGQVTGVKLTHVPYRNIAQFGPDLIAGTVQLGFQWYPNVAGPINAKGATALAVAGDKRLAALPDTPTTTEAGLPQYKVDGWFALAAPAGVPQPILQRLNKELNDALKDPAVIKGFEKAGAVPIALGLEASKKFHIDEIAKYRDIIAKAGIPKI